jgi:hypothetical protein
VIRIASISVVESLNTKLYSDVQIRVGLEAYSGHKAILAARSGYFAELLENNEQQQDAEIDLTSVFANKITSVSSIATTRFFSVVLAFIYDGFEATNLIKAHYDSGGVASVGALLEAAEFFRVFDMKLQCQALLATYLNLDNTCWIFQQSCRANARQLKAVCVSAIARDYQRVSKTAQFAALSTESRRELAEYLDDLSSSVFIGQGSMRGMSQDDEYQPE